MKHILFRIGIVYLDMLERIGFSKHTAAAYYYKYFYDSKVQKSFMTEMFEIEMLLTPVVK